LAAAGFFFTGYKDRVKCFRWGQFTKISSIKIAAILCSGLKYHFFNAACERKFLSHCICAFCKKAQKMLAESRFLLFILKSKLQKKFEETFLVFLFVVEVLNYTEQLLLRSPQQKP